MTIFALSAHYGITDRTVASNNSQRCQNPNNKLLFNFSDNENQTTNTAKYIVKTVIGNVICKTAEQKNQYSEYYNNMCNAHHNIDNSAYDVYEEKKAEAYKQYENGTITKRKYNNLCKTYYKEYERTKINSWNNMLRDLKAKTKELGCDTIPVRSFESNPIF